MNKNLSAVFSANFIVRCIFFTFFLTFVAYCFIVTNQNRLSTTNSSTICLNSFSTQLFKLYNNTYPLTPPIKSKNFIRLSGSYSKNSWSSFYLKGYLTYFPSTQKIEIKFDSIKNKISNRFSNGKRGLELSELVTFNGLLYACDDKTGIIYNLIEENTSLNNSYFNNSLTDNSTIQNENYPFKLVPNFILSDGSGLEEEPFKCEWLTVKDYQLYVGSFVEHLNWTDNFLKLKEALSLPDEGYLSHETSIWSPIRRNWYFLPRRISKTPFNVVDDESKGSNIMIEASEDFKKIKYYPVGQLNEYHGFSSAKFLPNFRDEIIVALKTKEVNDTFSTFITAFDLSGKILYPETMIDDKLKFEGIDFV